MSPAPFVAWHQSPGKKNAGPLVAILSAELLKRSGFQGRNAEMLAMKIPIVPILPTLKGNVP